MSKIPAVLIGGGGATAVAVGGTLLFGNGFGQGEIPKVSLLFDSMEKFEEGGKTTPSCVTKLFAEGFDESGTLSTTFPTGTDTFFSTTTTNPTPYESCVIVDGKRSDYDNNKWKDGKFAGTGTFIRGNEGFVNFNVAETISGETDKLKFTGFFYLVRKEKVGSESKGKVKNKKEVKGDSKKIGQSDLDNYFPKKGIGVIEAGIDSYGGFFKDVSNEQTKLQNVCGANDCRDASKMTPASKRIDLSGTGDSSSTDSDTKTLKDGSADLNGGENIYGATPGSLDSKISTFKGDWSKVTTPNS